MDFADTGLPSLSPNGEESAPAPLSKERLPALGLDALERDRYGFHVVGAHPNTGEDLIELFGEENALLVDADEFNPDHFTHQVDVLSRKNREPVRAIFQNLGEVRPEMVYEFEKLFDRGNGYPIKSVWFIDSGEDVDLGFRRKVLMRCNRMVDAATLLDAVAFGWGSQNPYNGQPVGGEVDMYGHDKDVIPSEEPLFNKAGFLP